MALKKIDENPKITDTILFEIPTPGADGCFTDDPYKVDKLTIYYLQRDFIASNLGEYERRVEDATILASLEAAKKAACDDPSEENLQVVATLQKKLDETTKKYISYYKEANPVKTVGTNDFPAWLSTDTDNALIIHVTTDENGNPQYGRFEFEWSPEGSCREGDYVICWTWTPLAAGESISSHMPFSIFGDAKSVTINPTHRTSPKKYEDLLERYLPEMYKLRLSDGDLTPETLFMLNQAIGDGFTMIEDLSNQIIDLLDANVLHESLLVYLANLFNLKLRSEDPTLWRRQIKQAIPVFKKKGTLAGLTEALSQAGIYLNKINKLWQISPKYIYMTSFLANSSTPRNDDSNLYFELPTSIIWPPNNPDNFQLWIRYVNTEDYVPLSSSYVNFYVIDSVTYMEWLGETLSSGALNLTEGDILLIKYEQEVVPGGDQTLEDYILSLPLMDKRDETEQQYPLKNWNIRLLSEDDALFNALIPVGHPFHAPIIFGRIRTEFPYSENVYNMEEYNGSTRESINPCHIDKDFLDTCGHCLSSQIDVYLEVENISDQRIKETKEILREYLPFHTQINSINYSGQMVDYVYPPEEQIVCLIRKHLIDYVIPGEVNDLFHRVMGDELHGHWFTRSELANVETVVDDELGVGYNIKVSFYAPDVLLSSIGIDQNNNILEVFAPSPNAGLYSLENMNLNYADLSSAAIEPINEEMFTYRLMNVLYETSVANIYQDDIFRLKLSSNLEDYFYKFKTQWDVDNDTEYTGAAWKVSIPAYSITPYDILSYNPESEELILDNSSNTLPTVLTTGITAELLTDLDESVVEDNNATLNIERRGRIDLNDGYITNVQEDGFIKFNDIVYYSGDEYIINGFSTSNLDQFYISGYDAGDVGSATISIRRILVPRNYGNFAYRGMKLNTLIDYEADLGIVNGINGTNFNTWLNNNKFKENFLVQIDSNYYKINEIDGYEITLGGLDQSWRTFAAGGTNVSFSILQISKTAVNIGDQGFQDLNRRDNEIIEQQIEYMTSFMAMGLNPDSMQDGLKANESISFKIEYIDGDEIEGNL